MLLRILVKRTMKKVLYPEKLINERNKLKFIYKVLFKKTNGIIIILSLTTS